MSDHVIPVPVCEDVEIKFCHEVVERDLEKDCMTHTTQHCVSSYEKDSFGGVEVRSRATGDTCEIEKATCNGNSVGVPKIVKCNQLF